MTTTLFPRRNSNPTHRNELLHIGEFYMNSADDSSRIEDTTIELVKRFYASINTSHFQVIPTDNPTPYHTVEDMADSINTFGALLVFRGDSKNNVGISVLNERTIHDYIHTTILAPFTLDGEMEVFLETARLLEIWADNFADFVIDEYDETIKIQAIQYLYSEIYLQACAYDYLGRYPDEQKVVLTGTPYKFN
jgi:hypothetical protein